MAEARAHFHGFDWLRVGGVIGVVWIHGCDTHALAMRWSGLAAFAVPAFVLVSFFLLQRSVLAAEPDLPLGIQLRRRLARLLPAYLAWSALYLVVRFLKHRMLGSPSGAPGPLASLLLGGASYQLYFVAALLYWSPFALLLARFNARLARRDPVRAVALNAALGASLLLAGAWLLRLHPFPSRLFLLQQMVAFTGFVPLGLAGALWVHRRAPSGLQLRTGIAAGLAGVAWLMAGPDAGKALASSLALFTWGLLACPSPAPAFIRRAAGLSYGVFLVHGFFIEGLQLLLPRVSIPVSSLAGTLAVIFLALVLSGVLCAVLNRIPRLRWLVA